MLACGSRELLPDQSTLNGQPFCIRQIVIENFKSYAGKHAIGPFTQPFTAIVGPNGSGKSNVIDALLFVFGFKARKMRQGKLADLIHVSDAHPSLDCCEVAVEFCLQDGKLLQVSRRVYKNNRSEYFIDGKSASYAQIVELLQQFGLDLDHNRFLILQGEVEFISLMKPKSTNEHEEGLLEYLEDIIGTNSYVPLIQQNQQQYEQSATQETEAFGKYQIVKQEKELIEGQEVELKELVRTHNEGMQTSNILLQLERYDHEVEIEKARKSLDSLQSKMQKEAERLQQELTVCNQMDVDVSSLEQNVTELERMQHRAKSESDSKEKRVIVLEEDLKHAKRQLEKLHKTIEEDKHSASKSTFKITELSKDIKDKQSELIQLEIDLANATQEFSQLKMVHLKDTSSVQQEIDSVNLQLASIQTKIAEIQKQLAKNQQEGEQFCLDRESNLKSINKENANVEQFKESLLEKQQETERLHAHSETLAERIQETRPRIDSLKHQISELNERICLLREDLPIGTQNRHGMIKMFEDEFRIRGIHGRLGDLGCIEDKYCHAVNCASGATMENIVVDSTQTAQRCVDALKQKHAGVCTFLILDQMKRSRTNGSLPAPRLVDLVECDNLYKDAFYHALRDTLVCDTMEHANQVAFQQRQRHRVVTLDGKLIDLSGAIAGGGYGQNSYRSDKGICPKSSFQGSHHKKSSKADLSRLTNEIADLERENESKREELKYLQDMFDELLNLQQETSATIKSNTSEIAHLKRSIESSSKYLLNFNEREKEFATQQDFFKELQIKVEHKRVELAELQQEASTYNAKIAQLTEKILQIGGSAYRICSGKVAMLEERKGVLQEAIAKAQAEVALNEKRLAPNGDKQASTLLQREQELKQEIASKMKLFNDLEKELEVAKKDNVLLQSKILQAKGEFAQQREVMDKANILKANLKNLQKAFELESNALLTTIEQLDAKNNQLSISISSLSFIRFPPTADGTNDEPASSNDSKSGHVYDSSELKGFLKNRNQLAAKQTAFAQSNVRISQAQVDHFAQEHRLKLAEFNQQLALYSQIRNQREEYRKQAELLRRRRNDEFMQGLQSISTHLKQMYQMITQGGNAELELVDSLDPFSEGIVFSVMPPKKSWKNIAHLSGGEKTLSSLALVFALHAYKPTPFYVMDEIDAALDYRNVAIIASYIKQRTCKDAQFLIISLRNGMFDLADDLIGVYKHNNCSQCVKCL